MELRDLPVQWDLSELSEKPKIFPAEGFESPDVTPLFVENEPWRGTDTRFFAWMGVPTVDSGKTCPGMVLLHGGGGTAYQEWVRIWNQRGYAAIAIDQCGCVPEGVLGQGDGVKPVRHPHGGPPGWQASFGQITEPLGDQWQFHAVSAALRAHSLLAAQPEVDPDRIGVTGISWGGYMTSIMAGVDRRYRFAVPVYGCGFLGDNSTWRDNQFPDMNPDHVAKWLDRWDPSHYLKEATCPMLWVSGTNDFAYPLDSLRKSHRAVRGESSLCVRVEMPHGHVAGWTPKEIGVFADQHVNGGAPLPRITNQGRDGDVLFCDVESNRPIAKAEIVYTRATGYWQDRKYNVLPAEIDKSRVQAKIPKLATVAFLYVQDDRDCLASSEFVKL